MYYMSKEENKENNIHVSDFCLTSTQQFFSYIKGVYNLIGVISQGVACRCHQVIFVKWWTFGVILIYFRLFALFWKKKQKKQIQYHNKNSLN
jgi:hypothetical protein